ncbi:polysaccharide pyruvyl transferase family protein [Endozoicomonas atrinae]|uniref:polysaccharide pyruvyl transferase family protein n=1 Tax=Endozoicomonas atrinae TaxID=1333660 RepID=UPI0008258F89|nr:polysaccharide pyruvyl transferase family protein [Endozoicomonas atrinae]
MLDIDYFLQNVVRGYTKLTSYLHCHNASSTTRWQPGQPLKLFLLGYNGSRNTGADVRVAEIIRQIQHILGEEQIEISLLTFNKHLTQGMGQNFRQLTLPKASFPHFLFQENRSHHGVIACEGSMFTSKFTDFLSIVMGGALGMAAVAEKLSIGYGAEVGAMNDRLRHFCQRQCQESLIICRNEPSRLQLQDMGIRQAKGTDTAWTFTPAPSSRAQKLLCQAGWDGQQKILTICPVNPFWWPVKPDLKRTFCYYFLKRHQESHSGLTHFHRDTAGSRQQFHTYIQELAKATGVFVREQNLFPVIIGMEQLDRRACVALADSLYPRPPCFVSDEYNMYEIVALLRQARYMVTSRYHAMVCSMPAKVLSVGLSIDERIPNLLNEQGCGELCLDVDEPFLGEKLLSLLRALPQERERKGVKIGHSVQQHLRRMGEMGMTFANEVRRVYPNFPLPDLGTDWRAYLPVTAEKIWS